jgi:twinkle protein
MDDTSSSRVVAREPCPDCGSSDNLARYEDGGAYCFTPGCGRFEKGDGEAPAARPRDDGFTEWLEGEVRAIPRRGLTEETAKKFDYRVADYNGQKVQVATYWRDGRRVFQKVRTADKKFWARGDDKAALYGQHLWPATGRRLVITEGEVDAMTVAQAFGLSWPVVSVPGGAGNALAAIKRELRWIEGYDEVVIWFDADQPGREAAEACARAIKPGKVKLAFAPDGFKDASDMLQAGDVKGICRVVYDARAWRPEGIVTLGEIRERALAPTSFGDPWPWPGVTQATFGRRPGEVYALGAGTGVGKTDFFTQLIAHDVVTLGKTCGVLYLEQPVVETAKRVAGKLAGKRFHVPDGSWTQDELVAAFEQVEKTGRLHLFDAFGATSWDVIGPTIRYMITGLGCEHVFLDHLTALAAAEDDERKALEGIMAELAGIAQETGAKIHFVSHLATPEGKPHEEGGRVMIRHFKGSRAIGFWSHFMFGLERDQQADDPDDRALTTLRCLKDRYSGSATGKTWGLRYDDKTGLLAEDATAIPPAPATRDRSHGDF